MEITDATLLKIMSERENYESYIDYVKFDALAEESQILLKDYRKYFSEFDHEAIDFEEFPTWFHQVRHPDLPTAGHKVYNRIFTHIQKTKADTAENVIKHFQQEATWQKLTKLKESSGFNPEEFSEVLKEYEKKQVGGETEGWVTNEIERIIQAVDRNTGLKWRLNCLNKATKGLIPGDFIIVAAYVDTGKTTFATSEATYIASQLETGSVLWFNNEEHNDKVLQKIWMSALGAPWSKIQRNHEKAKKKYIEIMHGDIDRIKLIDIRGHSINSIKKICKKENPKLMIFDQIDKINPGRKKYYADHDRLKSLYGEVRALANEYCPVIGISQADATTRWFNKETEEVSYQKYLDQSQLDGSKIGKPGEADIIITIGRDRGLPNSRFLFIPKNKVEGVSSEWRNLKVEVHFRGDVARYEDYNYE